MNILKILYLFLTICAMSMDAICADITSKINKGDATTSLNEPHPFPNSSKMEVFLWPTRMDLDFDWWTHVPTNSPKIITTNKVYKGDSIALIPSISRFTSKPNEEYELEVTIREGELGKLKDSQQKIIKGKWANQTTLRVLNELIMEIAFTDEDNTETHEIELQVENLKNGETAKSTAKITFLEWKSPTAIFDANEASDKTMSFNANFSPETLYSIFSCPKLGITQGKSGKVLNSAFYGFFRNAFSANKFLLPILRKEFESASPLQRIKTLYLFAIMGENKIEETKLTEKEVLIQKELRSLPIPNDPYKEIKSGADIDMLWGEFFAKGTYAPARRILDALLLKEERDFADQKLQSKKINKSDKAEIEKIAKGLAAMSAEWSIVSNTRNELFTKYLAWAVKNDMDDTLRTAVGDLFERAKNKAKDKNSEKTKL